MLESIWDSVLGMSFAAGLGWEPTSADLGSTVVSRGLFVFGQHWSQMFLEM